MPSTKLTMSFLPTFLISMVQEYLMPSVDDVKKEKDKVHRVIKEINEKKWDFYRNEFCDHAIVNDEMILAYDLERIDVCHNILPRDLYEESEYFREQLTWGVYLHLFRRHQRIQGSVHNRTIVSEINTIKSRCVDFTPSGVKTYLDSLIRHREIEEELKKNTKFSYVFVNSTTMIPSRVVKIMQSSYEQAVALSNPGKFTKDQLLALDLL